MGEVLQLYFSHYEFNYSSLSESFRFRTFLDCTSFELFLGLPRFLELLLLKSFSIKFLPIKLL